MRITTKRGDHGFTSLGEASLPKYDPRIEVLGEMDSLSSQIGYFLSLYAEAGIQDIQHALYRAGACVAGGADFGLSWLAALNKKIEELEDQTPDLTSFILPGGTPAAAWIHILRTTTRQCERRLSVLENPKELKAWCNRLSDYFFLLALSVNRAAGKEESSADYSSSMR